MPVGLRQLTRRLRWPRSRAGQVTLVVFALGVLLRCMLMIAYRPAFLGIPDSGNYIEAAQRNLFLDPVHPAGYAFFLCLLHVLGAHLYIVTFVQHALGVATALILFELGRRGASMYAGLVPAVVVLFNGLQLWTEHAPLSDPLFTFLIAAILLVTVRARRGRARILLLLGMLLAAATLVRTVGLLMSPLVAAWLLSTAPGSVRRRLLRIAVPASLALALVGAYVIVQHHESGVLGFTDADGRIAYAVAAPFADCAKFNPPPGTRGLCQPTPPGRRGSFNQYLWGFPDHASQLPPGGRAAVSPAWRLFGPMPNGNDELAAFGRNAILHQPVAYLREVVRGFTYYWAGSPTVFLRDAAVLDPGIDQIAAGYYSVGIGRTETDFDIFTWFARTFEVDGILIIALLAGSLLPLAVFSSEDRATGLLCAGTGWIMLGGAALIAVDPRYALPGLGPLATATAIGVAGIRKQVVTRRGL